MYRNLFLSGLILMFGAFTLTSLAQTTTVVKPSAISGEVSSINGEKIVLKTKDGDLEAVLSDKTQYFRVPPENPTISAAVASSASEIGVGDKLLVTGILSDDKKSLPAKKVYLITKSDIASRQSKNDQDWKTRSIAGKVLSLNLATNSITISVGRGMTAKNIVVKPKEKVEYYRYTEDSNKFSDAKKSTLGEIVLGDQIRVLGDKNTDGSEVEAEKIVTGSFIQVAGAIKTVDTEKNEIVITDFQTKKDVTIVINDASMLKQFPAEMAQRMAQFQAMQASGQGGFRPPTQGTTTTPPQNPPTQGQTPPNGQGGGLRSAGGLDDMLDRLPSIKVADLKVGEMIGVLSPKSVDPSRIKAIKLLSGVEPFVKQQQMATAGQGGGRSSSPNFSIPGLDGFGTP